jgi:molybdenum cofactor biosynthesis enzyme MoaA
MKLNNQYDFLEQRKILEEKYFENIENSDILKSISSVDITTIDLCNRTCVFCPRHDPKVYPNRNLRMTLEGATIIAKKLSLIEYAGTIAVSGFGENLLNPEIIDIITVLKKYNNKAYVECNTNGDPLNSEFAKKLSDTGINCININLYE